MAYHNLGAIRIQRTCQIPILKLSLSSLGDMSRYMHIVDLRYNFDEIFKCQCSNVTKNVAYNAGVGLFMSEKENARKE